MVHESYATFRHRSKHTAFHFDASAFERKPLDVFQAESSASSPDSSTNLSPITPSLSREDSAPLTPEGDYDTIREPMSGPQRTVSDGKNKSDKESDKEKRKRSRVTPEQLVHLERFFSLDRSPTAIRRKEISDLLGMQERQTQIWFQNRRAKAKLHDGKKSRSDSTETPPDTPPELTPGFQVELQNLIHEDEPVNMILCTDLSIGTWRRIATTVGKHDLVAYVSDSKRCLTWFIHSSGYGFKMEIPFNTILDTQFTNAAPGSGLASFVLSQPPIFYLENMRTPLSDGSGGRVWKRCADWTEGMQATKVLRHDLVGSAVQLAHLLRNLSTSTHGAAVRLHTPQYINGEDTSPTSVDIPQPPMAGLSEPAYSHREETLDVSQANYFIHGRKRSYSGPASLHHPHEDSGLPNIDISAAVNVSQGPASAPYPSSYHRSTECCQSNPYHSPMFSDYPDSQAQTPVEYDSVHLPDDHVPRMYSRSFYDEEARIVAPYELAVLRRDSSGSTSVTDLDTPSPPILTTPFHPPANMLQHPKPSELITGLSYESDEDIHHGHEIP
ncbi:hypothetical protein PILCRDRAFT_6622 [Piloderma croceum F 1598]|uniref:Homeobox domain-containing protein n=1 Tax=Piloderma croceum (strain F 1598) TaxID=765440 RepID=A0A0C3G106_PILCF|nr:hypothetical protein PILCRDRAFT_6622 [Piloderma croceum F 1598]